MLSDSIAAASAVFGPLPPVHEKAYGEESTDEGSVCSDGESSGISCPPPAKDAGVFSRAALQARGQAALARLAEAELEFEERNHQMTANSDSFPGDAQWYPDAAFHMFPGEFSFWECQSWESPGLMGEALTPPGLEAYLPEELQYQQNLQECRSWEAPALMESILAPPGLEAYLPEEPHQRHSNNAAGPVLVEQALAGQPRQLGQPTKVLLPGPEGHMLKQLDPGVPAKKRPPFPEQVGDDWMRQLDADLPAKKRVAEFLLQDMSLNWWDHWGSSEAMQHQGPVPNAVTYHALMSTECLQNS